jgi:hypothetical protein
MTETRRQLQAGESGPEDHHVLLLHQTLSIARARGPRHAHRSKLKMSRALRPVSGHVCGRRRQRFPKRPNYGGPRNTRFGPLLGQDSVGSASIALRCFSSSGLW